MATKEQPITYQIKVSLEDIRPPIWRRILVDSDTTLGELHQIIQMTMDWDNCHLDEFKCGDNRYGVVDDDFGFDWGAEVEDENQYQISDVLTREKSWLRYLYDFGDSWSHKVVLEKKLSPDPDVKLPTCVTGKRACPPDDCGGVWGYQNLIEIMQNPEHPEYEEMFEWLGFELDPEEFDIKEINKRLKK